MKVQYKQPGGYGRPFDGMKSGSSHKSKSSANNSGHPQFADQSYMGGGLNSSSMGVGNTASYNLDKTDGTQKLPNLSNKAGFTLDDWEEASRDLLAQLEFEKEENKKLKTEMQVRQSRYIKRETEYRRTIDDIEKLLCSGEGFDQDGNMNVLGKLSGQIGDNISNLQLRTAKVLQEQEKDIKKTFNAKLNEIKKKIEFERNKKQDSTKDMIEKKNKLREELEWVTKIVEKIDEENQNLGKKYSELRTEFKTQENDKEVLTQQLTTKKRENARLRLELKHYEEEYGNLDAELKSQQDQKTLRSQGSMTRNEARGTSAKKRNASARSSGNQYTFSMNGNGRQTGMPNPLHFQSSTDLDPATETRYNRDLNKCKRNIEQYKKRLRDAKTLYSKEMESKSILENLLRQCIEDVKLEITRKRSEARTIQATLNCKKITTGGFNELDQIQENQTNQDREKILEVLLSQERVLTLLYDKTFPPRSIMRDVAHFKGAGTSGSKVDISDEGLLQSSDSEPGDMEEEKE